MAASSITYSQQSNDSLLGHYLDDITRQVTFDEDADERMEIKKVPLLERYKLFDHKTRKCVLDSSRNRTYGVAQKTLLMVGQTGAGKTTLIDGMFNYISGVEWKDNFRYRLTNLVAEEEQKVGDDTISHTEWITVYSLPMISESRAPFCVNIIDTPGIGDTRGIEYDKTLIRNLTHFFNNHEGRHGVTSIDALCFVAKAPDGRLTQAQKYVFDSIMAIFGKNIKDNIFALATFSDGKKPKVYQAFDKAEIPINKAFKFNNCALFSNNGCKLSVDDDHDSDDDSDHELDKKNWENGMRNYRKLFKHILLVQSKSTEQTAELLRERLQLEALLDGISKDINTGCDEMYRLENENKQLEKHKEDMKMNRDFEIITTVNEVQEVENEKGEKALFCERCKTTCHYPCVKFDLFKFFCPAFNLNGQCNICRARKKATGKPVCSTKDHVMRQTHTIQTTVQRVTSYEKRIKELYDQAKVKRDEKINLMNEISKQYKIIKDNVTRQVYEAYICYNNISHLALREDPLSRTEFIDHLIEYEKLKKKAKFTDRVESLLKIKDTVTNLEYAKERKNPMISIQNNEELASFMENCILYPNPANLAVVPKQNEQK